MTTAPLNGKAKRLRDRFPEAAAHIRWNPDTRDWRTLDVALDDKTLSDHAAGRVVVGAFPAVDGVASVGVIDIDLHMEREPTAEEVTAVEDYARRKHAELLTRGIDAALLRHHRHGSFHIKLFTKPVAADRLGRWLSAFVADSGSTHVDTFPSVGGGGNAVRLPGQHHRRPGNWTEVLLQDGTWGAWPACVSVLLDLKDNPARLFPDPGKPKGTAPPKPPEPQEPTPDNKKRAVTGIAEHWPAKGTRRDAGLALAGGLLRAGYSVCWVEDFVRAVAAAAGDDEAEKRVRCVADTQIKLDDGEHVTGWTRLSEVLSPNGPAVVSAVRDWLGIKPEPRVNFPSGAGAAGDAPPAPPWPEKPNGAAFHGLAGVIVETLDPHTEADPVAVLVQMLLYFGSIIGRTAHFRVEADRHYCNEFAVLIGKSGKGRKGTSQGQVHSLYTGVDLPSDPNAIASLPPWCENRVQSGLSSGEGLIWAVRDPIEKKEKVKERGEDPRYETVIADEGVSDKRLLVFEPEFANVLKQTERQGNTLSTVVRQSWETGALRTLTKNSPAKATGAHVSIIGHITDEELRRYLTATETANGFGNRFMWFAIRRSKMLPEGGHPEAARAAALTEQLRASVLFASTRGELWRDAEARELWHEVYAQLSEGRPGLAGNLLGRAEAHVMRLATLYAVLNCSEVIAVDHLLAALALWDYAERSVLHVFGDSLGDPLADDLARFIRLSPNVGITKTDITNYLGRNTPASQLNRALALLVAHGVAHAVQENTGGRPAERWFPGRRKA